MRFVDLFAGLGGFHSALREEGHECVFASELDDDLSDLYEANFGLRPKGDIRKVDITTIPDHDILCAGLPCQPFSKAGDQKGFDCPQWGDLYQFVIDVLNEHEPDFFILENVPNLRKHNDGRTWQALIEELEDCGPGYNTDDRKLSPHTFGVPQRRNRIFVVGSARGLTHFSWPAAPDKIEPDLSSILDEDPDDVREMPDHYLDCMEIWQEFLNKYPKEKTLPSFPIWAMEFGATYAYEETTPFALAQNSIQRLRHPDQTGNFGSPIKGRTWKEIKEKEQLPSHATREQDEFPRWKIRYIQQNRRLGQELLEIDEDWFKDWIERLKEFPSSLQKFEWNCKGEPRSIWKHVIQFRASGVRVKRATTAPSLVAMTTTQIPIIGWKKRYMTRQECARLQSLGDLNHLPESDSQTFKALGNAVNATVVRCIAANLLDTGSTRDKTNRVLEDEGIIKCLSSKQEELELAAGKQP
jgi:DNA (cytosine-5)-methyltransferase 1